MTLLLERLSKQRNIELAVVAQCGLRDYHFKADGVEYLVVRTPWLTGIRNRLGSYKQVLPVKSQLRKCAAFVNDWNPQVVHVHGTESSFGLIKAWGLTNKPMVVSIQGLMAPCAAKAFGDLLPVQVHGLLRSVVGVRAECLRRWRSFLASAPAEEEILRGADMVLGRTKWDRAWAWALNPNVRYRHVDELIRPEFQQAEPWNPADCKRHQIYCTSAAEPLKGLHVLLDAVRRLRQVFPDVRLTVASDGFVPHPQNDYARFVLRMVREWKMEEAVTFLGFLDAGGIVEQLQRANCYVTPSFIENGCNALQEAMLVGTPCVATLTGGLLTTIESERTGLTFPVGDSALLAWQIRSLFENDALAVRLGSEARIVAQQRHDPERVTAQLMRAYEELIDNAVVTARGGS